MKKVENLGCRLHFTSAWKGLNVNEIDVIFCVWNVMIDWLHTLLHSLYRML